MQKRSITATSSEIIVEQLAGLGVQYVFNNSGSREALFFDALHVNPNVHGILGLHEGSVAAMAGGYTQGNLDPAVMVVHLGAGLAQCLGQLINVWSGSLPVVVLTFAGDTGSYGDRVGLDLTHDVGPTSIAKPFTKASWTVIEPDGLPQAIERALRVAKTPPVGPVHLAVYDRLLGNEMVTTEILEGEIQGIRAGYPADEDVEAVIRALSDAQRPLFYVGDGIWKSGAEARVTALAEQYGCPIAGTWTEMRRTPQSHSLHCGRIAEAVAEVSPDLIVCIGVRHNGRGKPQDFDVLSGVQRLIGIGPDVENFTNLPGLDLAILADEFRTLECLERASPQMSLAGRLARAEMHAASLHAKRKAAAKRVAQQTGQVRPWVLVDAIDQGLERLGGGLTMVEQYAVPIDSRGDAYGAGRNAYIRAAGGSEGYGIGGTIGLKLAVPHKPVVGLVGDGSMYYADSGLWTAAHHQIPVLFVIPNNRAYGIVATNFERAGGVMKETGEYPGVVLDGIDPVKIADGFGVEGMHVDEESDLEGAIARGLDVVEGEERPFLLDVKLPLGLPGGGRAATPFQLTEIRSKASAA